MLYGINPDDLAFQLIDRLSEGASITDALPLSINATAMEPVPVPVPCSARLRVLRELAAHLKPRSTLKLKKEQS